MNEATSPQSPEQTISPAIDGAPEGFQPEVLDTLVGRSLGKADVEKAWMLDEVLAEQGFTSSETDEAMQADYERAHDLYGRLLDMKTSEWIGVSEEGGRTERDVQIEQLEQAYAPQREESATPETSYEDTASEEVYARSQAEEQQRQEARGKSEALAGAIDDIDALTKRYAEQVAERSKRMIESAKTREGINASKEDLTDLIGAIATEMYDDLDTEGVAQEDIVRQIDVFVAEQTNNVIGRMEEVRVKEYEEASPLKKALLDKWASWGGEKGFITKGKLKKAAVFAVPGAAIGFVALPFVGAVAGGAAAGAAGFTIARSIGRRLAGAKLDAAADAKRIAGENSDDIRGRVANIENASHQDILGVINERSEAYRKRNRNRMVGGTAIAMTVGLASGTLADIIDHGIDWGTWKFGGIADSIHDHASPDQNHDVQNHGGGGEHAVTDDVDTGLAPGEHLSRDDLFNGYHATRDLSPEGKQAILDQLNGYKVKPGDTIWDLSEKMLGEQGIKNPTVYELDATKDVLLKQLQSQGFADSRGWLSAGDTIKLK